MKSSGELMCDELQKLNVEVGRVKDKQLKIQFLKFVGSLKEYLAETNQSLKDLREIAKVKDKIERLDENF